MKLLRALVLLVLMGSGLFGQNVLTWNVGLLSVAGIDIVPRVAERSRQIPAILARLAAKHDLDVIALQEVWSEDDAQAILATLAPLGYQGYRPVERSWTGVGSGLLVLWSARWKAQTQGFVPWATTAGWEGLSRKGMSHVTLADPAGTRMDVITFHMAAVDAPAGVVTDALQQSAWDRQFHQVAHELAPIPMGGQLVLLGDANVGPGYGQVQFDLLKGLDGAYEAPSPGLVTWDPKNPLVKAGSYPNEPPAWIDHVFLRPRPVVELETRALDLGLSDHYAVLVTGPRQR